MLPAVSSSSRLTRGARIRLRTLVLSSALVAAGIQPVAAQTVDDDDASMAAQQLNLPKDVTVFGQSDPNVRKATAIVNGRIITGTDVDQRLALIITANGGKVSDEEKERLRVQVRQWLRRRHGRGGGGVRQPYLHRRRVRGVVAILPAE